MAHFFTYYEARSPLKILDLYYGYQGGPPLCSIITRSLVYLILNFSVITRSIFRSGKKKYPIYPCMEQIALNVKSYYRGIGFEISATDDTFMREEEFGYVVVDYML